MTLKAPHAGTLEVICGPMFSGKSEELIRRLRRAKIARQSVAVFKHAFDVERSDSEEVVSHSGIRIDAYAIHNPQEVAQYAREHDICVIGIDEVQFFPQEIIATICALVDSGRRVIVGGLDLDFRGVPFGPMPTLLAIADKITKLRAICTECGQDAHFSQRLVNGHPARFDDPIVMVGAQEAYQARCRGCFSIDRTPNW
jgi:thymidine kinase